MLHSSPLWNYSIYYTCHQSVTYYISKTHTQWRDFSVSPVVKILHFPCRRHQFNPWLGNWDPTCNVAQPKKENKNKRSWDIRVDSSAYHFDHAPNTTGLASLTRLMGPRLILPMVPTVLWPPDVKSQIIRKDPDAGRDWRQDEKGTTENEIVGWHHWLNGHEFEQALGFDDGQGSLACCRSQRVGHDWAELNWTN